MEVQDWDRIVAALERGAAYTAVLLRVKRSRVFDMNIDAGREHAGIGMRQQDATENPRNHVRWLHGPAMKIVCCCFYSRLLLFGWGG